MTEDEKLIRRALFTSMTVTLVVAFVGFGLFALLQEEESTETVVESDVRGPVDIVEPSIPALPFTDVTSVSGIDFVHENGAYGARMLPETMGGGIAFFDYNNDSHQDLLLVNSSNWPWQQQPETKPVSKLYRGSGDGTFEDVSEATGLDIDVYGMGVAVGDYDGDGWSDVFVTAVGENRLLKNIKGQRFDDVTRPQGVSGPENSWSSSAAFLDYDRDGDLDLFVSNYVVWSKEINESVDYRLTGLGPAYGPPTDFAGTHSLLYRNDDGGFTEVSADAGIQVIGSSRTPVGKGLAVHPMDVNGDGWLDIVVANDTVRNFLFVNQRNGRFQESGVSYGLAFDNSGTATGAMGIDAAYYANDERLGIAIGNFANEMSSFYVMRGTESLFSDDAVVAGIGAKSRRALTFGTMFVDLDLDGRLDLVAANGHVEPEINRVQSSQQYAQPIQIFWNCGEDCSRPYHLVNSTLDESEFVGRGASFADIDGDGDQDLAITQVGGRVVLLRNDQDYGHHWVRLVLVGKPPNAEAIGTVISISAAGITQTRTVMPTRSYLSQVELPVTVGVGQADLIDEIEIRWPNGRVESFTDLGVDQTHVFQQR